MGHKTQAELSKQLLHAAEKIAVGSRYVHYKHPEKEYEIIALGFLEEQEKPCVVYKALYGELLTWVRSLENFLSQVEYNGSTVNRFMKIT